MTSESNSIRQPRSWAEDLKTYRGTRGARSFSAIVSGADVPPRYSRTNFVPFAATTHPLYPYNDFIDNPDKTQSDPWIQSDRYDRHGWGDVSLLKEDGYAGTLHPHTKPRLNSGKGGRHDISHLNGRQGLFEIIQQQNQEGVHDVWMGNALIDPTKGKRPARPPEDSKGRRDLFDVIHARNPGVPSDDSWIGNSKIDPAKGKAHPMGPEERRGRRDLQEIYTQSLLRETPQRQLELRQRGADPLSDGWIGNLVLNPNLGKIPASLIPASAVASSELMHGGTFKTIPPGHSDLPRRHAREVPPPVEDVALQVLNGTQAGVDDFSRRGHKHLEVPAGPITTLPRKDHLYAHMTYKPLSDKESSVCAQSYVDSKHYRRKTVPAPYTEGPGKGPDMLHHVPGQRVGMFVPFAGLAQQGRPVPKPVAVLK